MSNNEIVLEWVKFSKRDLDAAKYLNTMHPKPLEIICFHCQQSAEKILKAFLLLNSITPPKIHELNPLCEMCLPFSSDFIELKVPCSFLSTYGVQPRYPYEIEVTMEDTTNAIKYAEEIFEFTSSKLDIR